MSDTFSINEHDQVIPYTGGRRCNDTREWRDATDLELQQRDDILDLERDAQKKAARIATLTDQLTSLKNSYDLAMSGLEQPPEGYPSWEDWLASKFYELHRIFVGNEWRWAVYHKGVRLHGNPCIPDFFSDYPTALAAAKKEAGR